VLTAIANYIKRVKPENTDSYSLVKHSLPTSKMIKFNLCFFYNTSQLHFWLQCLERSILCHYGETNILNVAFLYCYAECRYVECGGATSIPKAHLDFWSPSPKSATDLISTLWNRWPVQYQQIENFLLKLDQWPISVMKIGSLNQPLRLDFNSPT